MALRNSETVQTTPLGGSDHPKDPTPLYFKLETILRAAIESREYKPGRGAAL
jgi:hypothetical protein